MSLYERYWSQKLHAPPYNYHVQCFSDVGGFPQAEPRSKFVRHRSFTALRFPGNCNTGQVVKNRLSQNVVATATIGQGHQSSVIG